MPKMYKAIYVADCDEDQVTDFAKAGWTLNPPEVKKEVPAPTAATQVKSVPQPSSST